MGTRRDRSDIVYLLISSTRCDPIASFGMMPLMRSSRAMMRTRTTSSMTYHHLRFSQESRHQTTLPQRDVLGVVRQQ